MYKKAEEHWLAQGKAKGKNCKCDGLICMRAEKTGGKCQKRLDKVVELKNNITTHRNNLKCMKLFTKHQETTKQRCIPAGTHPGSQGGAAVVMLQIRTDDAGCGVSTHYASQWSNFWKTKKSKPEFCKFRVAVTLTKRINPKVKTGKGAALIQSYAAVADAEGENCRGFIWIADMILREALGSTRFKFAEELLHET